MKEFDGMMPENNEGGRREHGNKEQGNGQL